MSLKKKVKSSHLNTEFEYRICELKNPLNRKYCTDGCINATMSISE